MPTISVEFSLYSTYGWYWFDGHLEEQDGRAVLTVLPDGKHPYAGTWLPEQRFPDWYNDEDDPRFTNVTPIVDNTYPDGYVSAHKEITFMTPGHNQYPPEQCTVKKYPYISNTAVHLASLHLKQEPTEEERLWLQTKAFADETPHFRAGHHTLEWVFSKQKAAHIARFVHGDNL